MQAAERGAQVREQTLLPLARLRPGAKPCKLKVLEEHTPCAWDTINLTADGLCLRVGIDWNTVAGKQGQNNALGCITFIPALGRQRKVELLSFRF